MASLSLKHIYKVYNGGVKAVNDFNMEIKDKEFIVFVGPSGCGKSTTLRMIAGLEDITAGELRIDDQIVNDFEPKDRNIAMVFQNYALYPHMSVYENMAFSLRTAHMDNETIHEKVLEAAEILGITEYLTRKPKALSGGQRQRVALGRAIVRNPKVFLLDEPLSNLDAKLRSAMRAEISRLHERLETTFIYVTHDQVEAMTMGTRIVVMKDGYIQQIDTPVNLYKYPDNMFVAGFIGTPQMNFFDAKLIKEGEKVKFTFDCGTEIEMDYIQVDKIPLKYMDGTLPIVFGIRPDDVTVDMEKATPDLWAKTKAVVSVVEVLGNETLVYANLDLNHPDRKESQIVIKVDPDFIVRRNDIIDIAINKRKFHVFDKTTENSIRRRLPLENYIKCNVLADSISFENQSFKLPKAINAKVCENAELVMPISAVILGKGSGKAKIQWIEKIDDKTLYFLKVNNLTIFAIEENKQSYEVGAEVNFDIDMRLIKVEEANIIPLDLTNTVSGTFIKEKSPIDRKKYNFFMNFSGNSIVPSVNVCKKLFSSMGTKIFHMGLEYLFTANDIKVVTEAKDRITMNGKVVEVLDYDKYKYIKVNVNDDIIIVKADAKVGDEVILELDPEKVSVKDKKLDIIIV